METLDIYEKEFELYLRDTDKNNKMRYSSYLNLLQEVGGLHASMLGHGLSEEIKTKKAWIVIAWNLEVFKRPSWNEKIKVRTWIGKIDKIYHYRDYEILDESNEIVAKAVAKWVMLDGISKKIVKSDETYAGKFPIVIKEDYDNNIDKVNSRINVDELTPIYEYKVQKRDGDKNNHMNNIVYLDLALEGLDEEFADSITNIEIHYKTECKCNDEIVFMKDNENKVYVLDKNKEKLHTVVILK